MTTTKLEKELSLVFLSTDYNCANSDLGGCRWKLHVNILTEKNYSIF